MTAQPTTPTITLDGLRKLTGATPDEIARLTRSKQITVTGGRVPLVAGIRAVLDLIRTSTKDASLSVAQDAARLARAEATEFALAVERRELVADQAVSNAILHLCGGIMRRMSIIPTRITRDIRLRRQIEAAVTARQHEIAQQVLTIDGATPTARRSTTTKRKQNDHRK